MSSMFPGSGSVSQFISFHEDWLNIVSSKNQSKKVEMRDGIFETYINTSCLDYSAKTASPNLNQNHVRMAITKKVHK